MDSYAPAAAAIRMIARPARRLRRPHGSGPVTIPATIATISSAIATAAEKRACGKCLCGNTEGEMPIYRAQLDSDLIWCFGAPTMVYHCSTAEIVGLNDNDTSTTSGLY